MGKYIDFTAEYEGFKSVIKAESLEKAEYIATTLYGTKPTRLTRRHLPKNPKTDKILFDEKPENVKPKKSQWGFFDKFFGRK